MSEAGGHFLCHLDLDGIFEISFLLISLRQNLETEYGPS